MESFDPPTITELGSQKNELFVKSTEIITGEGAESLEASACVYELASGDIVIAGTDRGGRDHNEDRVAVYPEANFVAVVDGIGGYVAGEESAEILSKSLIESPVDINRATTTAKNIMSQRGPEFEKSGAVFISARIIAEEQSDKSVVKFLEIARLGDAKLIIIRDNVMFFESKDHSWVQGLVDGKSISPDEALYHPFKHITLAAVSPKHDDKPNFDPKIKLKTGDLVLIMSDGISDNIIAREIAKRRKEYNLSPRQLFTWLSDITAERMQNHKKIIEQTPDRAQSGIYADGYLSEPKPDNRGLAIMEIK